MSPETKREESKPTTVQGLISQGYTLATDLKVEARQLREQITSSSSSESMLIKSNKAQAIENTAGRIEDALGFLGQRLAKIRPDPDTKRLP